MQVREKVNKSQEFGIQIMEISPMNPCVIRSESNKIKDGYGKTICKTKEVLSRIYYIKVVWLSTENGNGNGYRANKGEADVGV